MLAAAILTSLIAQAAVAVPPEPPTDLNRIRKGLASAAPVLIAPADKDGHPVFRVTVRGRLWERPLWTEDTMRPGYVRPMAPPVHFEFLSQTTTNEYFRAGVLYPPPFPISLPLFAALKWLGSSGPPEEVRRKREAKAREEVQKELEAFLKARKGGQVF